MNNHSSMVSHPFTRQFVSRTALITGASGGLGSQIAIAFAKAGSSVILQYNRNKPDQTLGIINDLDVRSAALQSDLAASGSATGLLNEATTQVAPPDILINCAAAQDVSDINAISEQDFSSLMKTNVDAVYNLSTEFARRQNNGNSASIINISSIEATRPAIGHSHYAISKAAIEMLTKSLALEYGPRGIRTNAIAPGLIEREGIRENWPQGVESWEQHCPLGRMANTDDIANACLYLASPMASFINGVTLTIDGGMLVTPGW